MKITNGKFCPLIQADCKGLECTFFIHLRGSNPNTGEPVDEWDCAVKWLPILLIENAQQSRQAGAATESLRNEIVKRADQRAEALRNALNGGFRALDHNQG
jgi:hypothetical protein